MSEHRIVHVEFPANSPAESAGFYSDLFGWKTYADNVGGSYEYWQFASEGSIGGGFNPVASEGEFPVQPGNTIVYVSTPNIEESLAKAESLGGKTVQTRMSIPGTGWFALFTDPTGNTVGLYTDDPSAE